MYSAICWKFLFVQDDAYISFRYVMNALHGHGLVYNIGERVEGFTNFGWVIILLIAGKLGFNLIKFSMLLGYLCGAGTIVVTWLIARIVLAERHIAYSVATIFIMAANGAFAYWSPAGLETAIFALMTLLSFYFYLSGNWLLIASLLAAVWIRPDGAVIAALLIIIEAIQRHALPRFTLYCTLCALVLSLPFVGFKLGYYGSILPNPFYAKTSFDLTQVQKGLEYVGQFFRHYGFLGFGLLLPLLFFRHLTRTQKATWLFLLGYIAYIILIGGDVLKVHRFFLPVFGVSAVMAALSLSLILQRLSPKFEHLAVGIVTLGLVAITWFVPLKTIQGFLPKERGFVSMMRFAGQKLLLQDQSQFTVACSTIGALGYSLMNHRLIDLVGLCDSTIARHPQTAIPGMESTWKEQAFNATYVLQQAPDYIVFATGSKPSSPAEQALFLYCSFLESYRLCTLDYFPNPATGEMRPFAVFRKVRPVPEPIQLNQPIAFVRALKRGIELQNDGKNQEALDLFHQAEQSLQSCSYPELLYHQAYALMIMKQWARAGALMEHILSLDSLVAGPHRDLYMTAMVNGDTATASTHRRYLRLISPGDLRPADSMVSVILQSNGR